MEHRADVQCPNCPVSQRRSDWDILRECFQNEQMLNGKIADLHKEHSERTQDLLTQLGASQLSHCSVTAHLSNTQQQLEDVSRQRDGLQIQWAQLHLQYNQLWTQHVQDQATIAWKDESYSELYRANEANQALVARQAQELQEQAMELEAAHATAAELGDMASAVLLTDDLATGTLDGSLKVTDIVLRNKHQEIELSSLRSKVEQLKNDTADDVPSLDYSTSGLDYSTSGTLVSTPNAEPSFVPLPYVDAAVHDVDQSSAQQSWEAYRRDHPWNLVDLE